MRSLRHRRYWIAAAIVVILLLAADATIIATHWPFELDGVTDALQRASSSKVHTGSFEPFFFPSPGCVLRDLRVVRGDKTLATVRELRVRGSWLAVLTFQHYVPSLRFERLAIRLPADIPPAIETQSKQQHETSIGRVIADSAVLEIERDDDPSNWLRLEFPSLILRNVRRSSRTGFAAVINNSLPPGKISATGSFGPWNSDDRGATPVAGSFQVSRLDLGHWHGIAGFLSGNVIATGTLGHIDVRGATDTPNFEVDNTGHPVHVKATYHGFVNGLNGDTILDDVEGDFDRTHISAQGVVQGDGSKTASFDFRATKARVEDLLLLFTHANPPSLRGPIVFRAHTVLPPGHERFIRKLQLDGDFGIDEARFTKRDTQEKIEEMSARARGEKDDVERVAEDLKGHVILRNGVSSLSGVSFRVPGATARGAGTYDLVNHQINLRGTVKMESSVSKAAGGIKSVLLKPFDPLFKRRHGESEVQVSMTGTYPNPEFHVSLSPKHR